MFQQSADNILSQATIRMNELDKLLPMSYGMSYPHPNNKERRAESSNPSGSSYDFSSMFSGDMTNQPPPFVILPRADLEFLKQEIVGLRNSMTEFQGVIKSEMQKLRHESQALRRQVESQRCTCKQNGNRSCYRADIVMNDRISSQWQQAGWDTPSTFDTSTAACSTPLISSDQSGATDGFGCSTPGSRLCSNSSDTASVVESKPVVQLLPNYNIYVNKLLLQIVINEAQAHKDVGSLYLLRRLIPLVFTWEELACSRGQGLSSKSSDALGNKHPLDPTRVMACKAYMRKFCLEYSCVEPSEREINQTFNHQVNYSRRRIRGLTSSRKRPRSNNDRSENIIATNGLKCRRSISHNSVSDQSEIRIDGYIDLPNI